MIESNRVEYKQKLTDGLEITSAGGLSVIKNRENFILKDVFLRVVFFSNRDKIKTNELLSAPLKKLLLIVKENRHSTKEQLMYSLNVSRATITRYIKPLKDKNFLERVGSDKSGYWKVLDA